MPNYRWATWVVCITLFIETGSIRPAASAAEVNAQVQPPPDAASGDIYRTDDPIFRFPEDGAREERRTQRAVPNDPQTNIEWSAGMSGVSDIQAAFNNARQEENTQLGTALPMLTLPSQSQWNGMSDGDRMLWLINRERIDRGIDPLDGVEVNVTSVAKYYAEFLIKNDAWSHYADGQDPWQRLDDNPRIRACRDFLSVAENLAVFRTDGSAIALPIERSVYLWMYADGDCCDWGHRHAILWYPYNDNSGTAGKEGFLGVGRASGPYETWNFAEMIVMNVFDPCSTWDYSNTTLAGDINDIEGLEIGDAIVALQVSAGMTGLPIHLDGEATGDLRIGLEDALYVLRMLSR